MPQLQIENDVIKSITRDSKEDALTLLKWNDVASEVFHLNDPWKGISPDGVWRCADGSYVIAEFYARIGILKSGHCNKIAKDILKLIKVKDEIGENAKVSVWLILPRGLEKYFNRNGWLFSLVQKYVVLVDLSTPQILRLRAATKNQAKGIASKKEP